MGSVSCQALMATILQIQLKFLSDACNQAGQEHACAVQFDSTTLDKKKKEPSSRFAARRTLFQV